jgi:hypothetical protein
MEKRPLFPYPVIPATPSITRPNIKASMPARAQLQAATPAFSRSSVTVPPVYRPQNSSGVAQAKAAPLPFAPKPAGRLPAVPPVFKAQSLPLSSPVQAKTAFPVHKVGSKAPVPPVLQQARLSNVVQRASAGWQADASDTESELDSDVDSEFAQTVTNWTKRKAMRQKNYKLYTKRDPYGRRTVPRVNNRKKSVNGLAHDAKTIHDTIPEFDRDGNRSRTFGATTVVCALYQKNDGSYRKYCYNNLHRTVSAEMKEMAESLGYHFVIAHQAHAEAEMIMHSHTRTGMRLLSIGCDKDHCAECGKIIKHFYGKKMDSETAYSNDLFDNYYMPETLQDALGVKDDTRPSKW